MTFNLKHYQTGEEIRPGDRITLSGKPGKVLFVLGLPGVPPEWESSDEWLGTKEGYMIDVNGLGWVFQNESDEDLVFVNRKQ